MKHMEISVASPLGSAAKLYPYLLDNYSEIDPHRKRPLVIVVPGGGYEKVSDREAEAVAIRFLAAGFHAAVLKYSVHPAEFPQALEELAWSVAHLRARAEELAIRQDKIFIAGFSAGGHLAASLGVFWQEQWLSEITGLTGEAIKPNGLILSYPVITSGEHRHEGSFRNLLGSQDSEEARAQHSLEKQVTGNVPPVFLWHTLTDAAVPVQNSLLLANALAEHGVSVELHIFPEGPHGLALADKETMVAATGHGIQRRCADWIGLAIEWLRDLESH